MEKVRRGVHDSNTHAQHRPRHKLPGRAQPWTKSKFVVLSKAAAAMSGPVAFEDDATGRTGLRVDHCRREVRDTAEHLFVVPGVIPSQTIIQREPRRDFPVVLCEKRHLWLLYASDC